MVSWRCPRCEEVFFSSYRAEKDKYVKCIYCGYMVLNPYYEPPQEDLREKQVVALEKGVVELEAENRELEAQCAAMREALNETVSLLSGEKKTENDLTIWGPGGYNIVRIDTAIAQGGEVLSSNAAGKSLLKRIATLEAVTEAAKEYVEQCRCTPSEIGWKAQEICTDKVYLHGTCPRVKLKKALAALEGVRMSEQEKIVIGDDWAGIEITAKKEGIEIFGWYDHIVGLRDPELIPWEKIDELRAALAALEGSNENGVR